MTTTHYLLDGGNVIGEVTGDATTTYLRGVNLISSNGTYYLYNAHGDVVQLTNTNGELTRNYNYDAFGNERDPDEADSNPFRYCGEYYDTETGLYYLRARYYDPLIGRFTQEDTYRGTAKDPLSLNYYTYCNNDPVNYFDPDGHMPVQLLNSLYDLYAMSLMSPIAITNICLLFNEFNLYNGFHEIAQLNIARHLHINFAYSPILEYRINAQNEADIVSNGRLWEVKPITRSGTSQVNRYIEASGLKRGHGFGTIDEIPIWDKYKMKIESDRECGVAHYSFYYTDEQGNRCIVTTREMYETIQEEMASIKSSEVDKNKGYIIADKNLSLNPTLNPTLVGTIIVVSVGALATRFVHKALG